MHQRPGAGWLLHPLLDVAQPGAFSKHTKPLYGVKVDYYMITVANREQVIQVIEKHRSTLALWILSMCRISRRLVLKSSLIVCASINAAGLVTHGYSFLSSFL